jgi:hypothetical protein
MALLFMLAYNTPDFDVSARKGAVSCSEAQQGLSCLLCQCCVFLFFFLNTLRDLHSTGFFNLVN